MSLLMDALKRAEQAKREQGQERPPAPSGEMQLEPVEAATPAARPGSTSEGSGSTGISGNSVLPDLNSHLESVDAELKATAAEPAPRVVNTRRSDSGIDRAVAQNVLAAGAANATSSAKSESTSRIVAIIGVGALALAGVGGYFYWQLQGIAQHGNRLAGPGIAALPPRAALPPPAPITSAPTMPALAAAPETPAASPSEPSLAAGSKADRRPTPRSRAAASARSSPATPSRPRQATAPATPLRAESRPAANDVLRVTSQSQDSLVMVGYHALQAGRFAEAQNAYREALRADPRDLDALLGLASLAHRNGEREQAADYYERVLSSDPRNAAAHAGMISLQGGGDPSQAESRLKSLISSAQGDSLRSQNSDANATSALNFALGNLYAGQRRWAEAQQAYFKAYTADAGNPDTLYNLAISLEHLNQAPLARKFYEQAIGASRQRAAAFDRTQAEQRVATLAR